MPLFILTCIDKVDSLALRMANRPSHLAYLEGFTEAVKVAGPLLSAPEGDPNGDPIGSHFILEFDTLDQAKAFADADPYAKAGLFESTQLTPFRATIGRVGS